MIVTLTQGWMLAIWLALILTAIGADGDMRRRRRAKSRRLVKRLEWYSGYPEGVTAEDVRRLAG